MIRTNQGIRDENGIINDDMMTVNNEDKKIARKSYQELSNTEFAMNRNSLSQWQTLGGVPCLTH